LLVRPQLNGGTVGGLVNNSYPDRARTLAEDLSEIINCCASVAAGRQLRAEHLEPFRAALERTAPVLPRLTAGGLGQAMDLLTMTTLVPRILSTLSSDPVDSVALAELCGSFVRCVPLDAAR
jgi:hypothetical protein